MIIVLIIELLILNSSMVEAQTRDLTWYFGKRAAIEFRSGIATASLWRDSTKTAAGMLWGKDGKPILYMNQLFSYNAAGDKIKMNPPQLFNAPECVFVR